jgi:hypothetical protein
MTTSTGFSDETKNRFARIYASAYQAARHKGATPVEAQMEALNACRHWMEVVTLLYKERHG